MVTYNSLKGFISLKTPMLKNLFSVNIFRSIDYFGSKIKLRRMYFSTDSYALDYLKNISKEEVSRLERIMKSVPFGPFFNSKNELLSSFVGIRFPGYGSSYANQLRRTSLQKLELMSIEIPCTGKYRYFVVEEKQNGSFLVVADFTAEARGAVGVRDQDGSFEFLSRSNEVMFVKTRSSIS